MLIYSFNSSGSGSYRDSVSGTLGVKAVGSDSSFKKTEKLFALDNNGSTPRGIGFTKSLSGKFDIVFAIKVNINCPNSTYLIDFSYSGGTGYMNTPEAFNMPFASPPYNFYIDGVQGTRGVTNIRDGKWHLVIMSQLDIVSSFFTIGSFFNYTGAVCYCQWGYVQMYDHELTTQERNNLYKDFLRNKGTGSSIYGNPDPIKPTDLSNIDGLVAAYNFKVS